MKKTVEPVSSESTFKGKIKMATLYLNDQREPSNVHLSLPPFVLSMTRGAAMGGQRF